MGMLNVHLNHIDLKLCFFFVFWFFFFGGGGGGGEGGAGLHFFKKSS